MTLLLIDRENRRKFQLTFSHRFSSRFSVLLNTKFTNWFINRDSEDPLTLFSRMLHPCNNSLKLL